MTVKIHKLRKRIRLVNLAPFLFRSSPKIAVTVKLFGGLDTFAGIENYDPDVGLSMEVPENIRLGLCSSLLTGCGLPFTGRFMAVGKSPLTGGPTPETLKEMELDGLF